MNPLEPWTALDKERVALPLEAQAVFVLVCVESTVSMRPMQDDAACHYISAIWDALEGNRADLSRIGQILGNHADLDDRDDLAALLYAIQALNGSQEAADWAARRVLDATYDRLPRASDDSPFPSLAVEAAHELVQEELRWQRSILDALRAGGSSERAAHLRERARTRGTPDDKPRTS